MDSKVRFAKATQQYLSRVIQKYDLSVIEESDDCVLMSSEFVEVFLSFDRLRSYEVACSFVLKSFPNEAFTLREVCQLSNSFQHSDEILFQAGNEEKLIFYLKEINQQLLSYCHEVLVGDQNRYMLLRNKRRTESEYYTHAINLSSVMEKAEKAWLTKDFSKYIAILENAIDFAPPVTQMKFKYALRQLSEN